MTVKILIMNFDNNNDFDDYFDDVLKKSQDKKSRKTELQPEAKAFFEARKGRFTASEIHKLMGDAKKKGEVSAVAKSYIAKKKAEMYLKTGEVARQDISGLAAIRWGNENELNAIFEFSRRFNIVVDFVGANQKVLNHATLPFSGTPDGFIGDDGLLEVKCPFLPENHIANFSLTVSNFLSMRTEYYYQMQSNLYLSGRKYYKFVSYDPQMIEGMDMFCIEIPRDETIIQKIETRVKWAAGCLLEKFN